jgi:membrane-associated phospholipid phosphatase
VKARTIMRALALGGGAFAVGVWTTSGRGREVDDEVFDRLHATRGPAADAAVSGITELGSIWASVGGAAALAVFGRRRAATRGLAAAGAAWLLGQGMKKVFLRPRPYTAAPGRVRLLIEPPRATSWPSSHPMVLLAFLTAAGGELDLPAAGRAALTGLAGAIGVSRTYVGVHYPSDVVGGLLLGKAVGEVFSDARR